MIVLGGASLCLVTDRRAVAPDARTVAAQLAALERQLDEAVEAGIDVLQLRENDLPVRDLLGLAGRIALRSRDTTTQVLVNDRADIPEAIRAFLGKGR